MEHRAKHKEEQSKQYIIKVQREMTIQQSKCGKMQEAPTNKTQRKKQNYGTQMKCNEAKSTSKVIRACDK